MRGPDDGRMRCFGPGVGNPDVVPEGSPERVAVPVGDVCAHCGEPFVDDDVGVTIAAVLGSATEGYRAGRLPYHGVCFQRSIVGSVGHVLGRCSCYGGDPDADRDPPGLSRREAAALAVALWRRRASRRK